MAVCRWEEGVVRCFLKDFLSVRCVDIYARLAGLGVLVPPVVVAQGGDAVQDEGCQQDDAGPGIPGVGLDAADEVEHGDVDQYVEAGKRKEVDEGSQTAVDGFRPGRVSGGDENRHDEAEQHGDRPRNIFAEDVVTDSANAERHEDGGGGGEVFGCFPVRRRWGVTVDEDEGEGRRSDEAKGGKQRRFDDKGVFVTARQVADDAGSDDEDSDDTVIEHGPAQVAGVTREVAPGLAVEDEAKDGSKALDEGLRRQWPPVRGDQAVDEAEDVGDTGDVQR